MQETIDRLQFRVTALEAALMETNKQLLFEAEDLLCDSSLDWDSAEGHCGLDACPLCDVWLLINKVRKLLG